MDVLAVKPAADTPSHVEGDAATDRERAVDREVQTEKGEFHSIDAVKVELTSVQAEKSGEAENNDSVETKESETKESEAKESEAKESKAKEKTRDYLEKEAERVEKELNQTSVRFKVAVAGSIDGADGLRFQVVERETGKIVREFPPDELMEQVRSGEGINVFVDAKA